MYHQLQKFWREHWQEHYKMLTCSRMALALSQASPLLRVGEGLVTVAGSYMMLHNHTAVSAPCHMIMVMTVFNT